jgi:hypothetical protein
MQGILLRAYACLIFAFSTIGAGKAAPDFNKISSVPGIDVASLRDALTTIRVCELNAELAGEAINGASRHETRGGCLGAVPINEADQGLNTLDEKVIGQIGEFRRDMDEQFERLIHLIGEQFDSLQTRVDGRFDAWDGRFDAWDARFDTWEGRFGKVETMILGLYGLVTAAMVVIVASSRAPPSELDSFVGSLKHVLEFIPLVNKLPFVGEEKTNKA